MEQDTQNLTLIRKRVGRPPKTLCSENSAGSSSRSSSTQSINNSEVLNLGVSASLPNIPSTSDDVMSKTSAERRRSSRKKVIKFDVRDLLNKNRKTHKIQIEARIDSNAPPDHKASLNAECTDGISSISAVQHQVTPEEMLVKKKTFMEKSAIFRRYSISMEQPKQPVQLPLPPPPLLLANNAVEMKQIKPASSLILAQMENATNVITFTNKKKKQTNKVPNTNMTNLVNHVPQQQKKRGRPPKNKTTETTTTIGDEDSNVVGLSVQEIGESQAINKESIVQWSPSCANNWKEYKAAVNQSRMQPYISTITSENDNDNHNDNDNDNTIIEVFSSPVPALEETTTTESQLSTEMQQNIYEPDIISSPYEEIIIETTSSPSAIVETESNFFQQHFYTNDETTPQYSSSTCPTDAENYKSADTRTDMLINEQLVNSLSQSADNVLLNEFSINSHGNNSNAYNFANKLRVNVKRALLPQTSSTVYNINSNKGISKHEFDILNSDVSSNIEIETDTNEMERTPLEPFCHPIGQSSTSKVTTFTSNGNETSQQSVLNVQNLVESPFANQISEFNNVEDVVVEDEECHDTIVMSDDGFNSHVIVLEESSSNGTYVKTTPQIEYNGCRTFVHKQNESKGENKKTKENTNKSAIGNQFTEITAVETIDTAQDNVVVVHEEKQSANNISSGNVVVNIIDNQLNVLGSCDMANIENKDNSLNLIKQTGELLDAKKYVNVAEEINPKILYVDDNRSNESLETIVKTCKKFKKSRFKNLYSPEHSVEKAFGTSRLQNDNEVKEKVMSKKGATQCDSSKVLIKTNEITFMDKSPHSEILISEEKIAQDSNEFNNNTSKEMETKFQCAKIIHETNVSKCDLSKERTEEDKFQSKVNLDSTISPVQCQYSKHPSGISNVNQSLINSITISNTNNIGGIETKLDTKVVHQVHIETNTLIDILRQVQTNNEANEAILNKNARSIQIKNVIDTFSNEINQSNQNLENRGKNNIKKNQFGDDIYKTENEKNDKTFSVEVNVTKDINMSSVQRSVESRDQTINEELIKNISDSTISTTSNVVNNPIHDNVSKSFEQSTEKTHSKALKDGKNTHLKKSTVREKSSSFNKQEKLLDAKKRNNKTKIKSKHKEYIKNQGGESKLSTTDAKFKSSHNSKQSSSKMVELQDVNRNKDTESQGASVLKRSTMEEKLAKKRRQSKLKEAFEAALKENVIKKDSALSAIVSSVTTTITTTGQNTKEKISNVSTIQELIVKESPVVTTRTIKETTVSVSTVHQILPSANVEDDSDPLKDIEKFIEDGVNLLKKDYKIEKNNIDVIISTKANNEQVKQNNNDHDGVTDPVKEEMDKIAPRQTLNVTVDKNNENEDQCSIDVKQDIFPKEIINTFETPSDTPIATPTVTPPPKSPITIDDMNVSSCSNTDIEENAGVRRSHRIKQITKTPKALVGRGLVRDKERFSIKDDVEMKTHYSLDDHLTDLAEVEAKNAKFLKDMEERLSNFHVIKENEYKCERVISREAKKMICDCFLTIEEEERGELGCGEDCLNRLLMIECGPDCNVKERCTNKRFQKSLCSPCRVFRTEKKGFGILADIEILPGEFIMEYVGEVIDGDEFERRRTMYSRDKNRHYYFMALRSDAIIDATIKGNISRFINHSCDPNAETQKWTVNGELRIGFFSRKSIMPGEEITFDYQYQRYGREAQRCYCESTNCRGWIGQEPTSDEGEQVDYDSDFEEDEEDSSNLLVGEDDEEEDSDASVPDPEEVQKKLEMAAAEAEAELAPITLDESKLKYLQKSKKGDPNKGQTDMDMEDSKNKFKNLLNKMAEKVAAKQKQNKRELRLQRKQKTKKKVNELAPSNKQRYLEDPDIEDEVEFLKRCGVKNQSDTLRLSRLMVRAKLVQTRLNLLEILRKGELPCRRLFLDYHGLRLVHGWMSEDGGNMQIRLALLQTLETLPIANKTVLTDTKVLQVVRSWCGSFRHLSPNDDSSKESCASTSNYPDNVGNNSSENSDSTELQKLATKLVSTWDGLPEIFRIPKKERIEQMKEHEREADRQYAANAQNDASKNFSSDHYQRDRFGRGIPSTCNNNNNRFVKPNNMKSINTVIGLSNTNRVNDENMKHLSKAQRRKMFAARVAREEADKRLAEERREFETKCRFFGLDPKLTRPQDIPFCVDQFTGQWYSLDRKPIATPPIYAHVQLHVKPKSSDPADYQLPSVVEKLPPQWKYSINSQGKIYYYHIKYRIPQWEPPSPSQLKHCELETNDDDSENELCRANDSSDDEDDVLIGMDAVQLKAYIEKKVEARRQKRYQRLVDERAISPRREEDRIYNQMEVRKYKENKEKIRKRKEGIRRKRAEALRQCTMQNVVLVKDEAANSSQNDSTSKPTHESDENSITGGVLPIQDYLLSSDEEDDIKAECNNSPLIDKIVEGDKIVDELDALTTKRPLKRPLPLHRNSNEASTSATTSLSLSLSTVEKPEYKKRKTDKKEKRRSKDIDVKYRKLKEKFRCEIAGIIVHHLKPYRKDTCTIGRIQSNEDFNHLARKLTHFVMIKELKYCESVGQTLIVTESVKNKSREFIKKYMAKYGDVYVKPNNDPEFKDIPYTL